MRAPLVVLGVVICSACGGGVTAPTSRAPTPTSPAPAGSARSFTIDGAVHDTIGRPVAQARVEVANGQELGTAVLSDASGRYSLAVSGPSLVRASKTGYGDRSMTISNAQAARFFRLDSANGSVNLGRMLSMTFAADSACAGIPGYARRRTYDADSTGGAGTYLITLSGGGYNLSGRGYYSNVLYTGVFEDTAQINFSDPPIWERFPQGSSLVINGSAEGLIGTLPATLPLDAQFAYCPETLPADGPRCAVPEVTCRSSNHRLTVAVP